jgi:hypothetical protein
MYKCICVYWPYIRSQQCIIDSKKCGDTSIDNVNEFPSGHQQATTGHGVSLIINGGWGGLLVCWCSNRECCDAGQGSILWGEGRSCFRIISLVLGFVKVLIKGMYLLRALDRADILKCFFSSWHHRFKLYSPVVTIYTTGFHIQQFYILRTQCIYVFCVDLRTKRDYFPIQHELTGIYKRDLTL